MCGGVLIPAMSKIVGAKSMFKATSFTLRWCETKVQVNQLMVKMDALDERERRCVGAALAFQNALVRTYLHTTWLYARSAHQERNAHIEFERERFAFHQAKLPQMVSVVRRVDDVRILEVARRFQLFVYLQKTKCLQPTPH